MIKFFQDEIEIWKQKQADYRARLASMSSRHAKDPESVSIKALEQMVQHPDWPEQGQRRMHWFSLPEAADAVEEPELKVIIRKLK